MKLKAIAANMTELTVKNQNIDGKLFFSYNTPVAFIGFNSDGLALAYKTEKKWSATTSRHISKWARLHGFSEDNPLVGVEQSWLDGLI